MMVTIKVVNIWRAKVAARWVEKTKQNEEEKETAMAIINCGHCRAQLVLPPEGASSIRCAICHGVTQLAPPSPATNLPPPNFHGSKKALICGVSYRFSRHELRGCLNDAKCMKYLLTNRFQFPESSILLLTEDQPDPLKLPTRRNILMAMYWLMQGCQPGDSLVFHFSGHGAQQRNLDGTEVDGMDETILPLDFETQGMIVDNEINAALVRPLPHGVRLHAIVDACHSGTALDLPFLCKIQGQGYYVWEDHRPRNGVYKGTNGGEAFCFSGCDDRQTSADTSELSRGTYTGAMTFCFIQAIERGHARTYRELLNSMRYDVSQGVGGASNYGGPLTTLVEMMLTGGSLPTRTVQEPQLTAANPFNIDVPFAL